MAIAESARLSELLENGQRAQADIDQSPVASFILSPEPLEASVRHALRRFLHFLSTRMPTWISQIAQAVNSEIDIDLILTALEYGDNLDVLEETATIHTMAAAVKSCVIYTT